MNPSTMTRREALSRLGLLLGGAMIGGDIYLRGATIERKLTSSDFSVGELALLDEIGDTIIPTTGTPGAKAVAIGAFMAMMVNECYDDAHHAAFKRGIGQVDATAKTKYGAGFMACTPVQRTELLNALNREQHEHTANIKAPAHYFKMMKQLTLLGYFTSEVGATQALRHSEVPGGFDGNALYKKGDRAWFEMPSRSV